MERARKKPNYRATVGVAIAALVCVWGALIYYRYETAYQRKSPDPYLISAQFQRLHPVRAAVPASAVMGYLTDAPAPSVVESSMFLSAQYVLAPRLLLKGAAHEWVLGNYTRPADFAEVARSHRLQLEQDFGNGVLLFRRKPRL
jgi:hypothetical protein